MKFVYHPLKNWFWHGELRIKFQSGKRNLYNHPILISQSNKTNSDIYSLIYLLSYNRIDSESLFLLSDLNEFTNWLSSIPNEAKNRVTLRLTQGEKCRARAMKLHSVFLRSQFHSRSSVRRTIYNSHSLISFKSSFSWFDNSDLWPPSMTFLF